MYSKSQVKSYARQSNPKRSYKRNIVLPVGVTELATSLLSGEVMSRAKDWAKGKKTKLAKNLIKRKRRNPNSEPISPEVEDMAKQWHGREIEGVTEIEETETYEGDLVELGDLEELGILGFKPLTFKKDQPKVVCDGDGHNLEIMGGDQLLDGLDKAEIDVKGKRLIPLGYLYSIVYVTDKHHLEGSSGYPEPYQHYFAEDFYKGKLDPNEFIDPNTKEPDMDEWFSELEDMGIVDEAVERELLPMVVYDKTDCKILVAGGNYQVTELGIKD